MNDKWHKRYMKLAKEVSTWSKDPRKKVGAVAVEQGKIRGVGFNGFPRGVDDSDARLLNRDIKNLIMVHAEVNALIAADGQADTLYVYPCLPCAQCLGLIKQYGSVKTVVTLPLNMESSWNQALVVELAAEVEIEIICLNFK